MKTIEVPVLIVGGGGAGLTASMLFSKLSVDTLLINALPTTSVLPKAHVLNQRAMEIFTDAGVADEIYAQGTPPQHMSHTAFYIGLAGDDPAYGRQLARLEAWGAGGADLEWAAASRCRQTNLPQIRLEPLLKAGAERLAPGKVRFHTELLDFEQDANGVTATVVDRSTDESFLVRSQYLLGCDGGRTVGPRLGVSLDGVRDLFRIASVYMTADLSRWARDPEVLIRWLFLPHLSMWGTLVPMGPKHWGPQSEEWVFHLNYENEDTRAMEDDRVVADMKQALGLPDLDARVHVVSRWTMEGILADRFRVGRVFLVGDAAHRHPPTGGLGLTSAVHDAHNLCWKIAAVLEGVAGDGLLDTYEAERRPADGRNVQRSLENGLNHASIGDRLGFVRDDAAAANLEVLRRCLGDRLEDRETRRHALSVFATQSMEFREHFVEYGYAYDSAAICREDAPPPESPDPIRIYTPSTRPGAPLPHAEIEDADGKRLALMDLFRPGRFLAIAGESGAAWVTAARALADEGWPIDGVRLGHLEGDYRDPRCTWLRYRGVRADGIVLVRPDRFVGWRSPNAVENPQAALRDAMASILCRREV